ncbi:hydrolase [Paracoccus methylarcula]|uniref:Hydrolase n=1 Tax=Paracoccus methylarcula TaxID=72022 RepID=A0A422QZA4_9RHOB|nr:hydrolase [Paracoccus methylarcula]RNF35292.1 hydrolase [Paracoccus methylarcula]
MPIVNFYRLDRSAIFASQSDPRFAYCTYMPSSYEPGAGRTYPLAVLVHGSLRNAYELRDQFVDFAERHECALLAPLFPCGIFGPDDFNNYKHLAYRGLRYDLALLDMIDEISEIFPLRSDRFLMHGFSGGAQFAHRFYYCHPDRLLGVSIAAPGTVTLPEGGRPWWVGTSDMETVLGVPLRLDRLRNVAVQLVIGAEDTNAQGVTVGPGSSFAMPGANDAGPTRMERLCSLRDGLAKMEVPVDFEIVPGAGHDGARIQGPVKEFFRRVLSE